MDIRTLLIDELRAQRNHVLGALEGLDEHRLSTPHLPVTWSPLAVVHHLALDVERWWFGAIVEGDPGSLTYFDIHPDGAWIVPPETDVIGIYRSEAECTDAVIAGTDLDHVPHPWPEFLGPPQTLAQIVIHVIGETAAPRRSARRDPRVHRWQAVASTRLTQTPTAGESVRTHPPCAVFQEQCSAIS